MHRERPLYFTRHARNRLRRWRITEDQITQALEQPDAVTPSYRGRYNAWRRLEASWLRVTYLDEETRRVVITVTLRRRGPEGG